MQRNAKRIHVGLEIQVCFGLGLLWAHVVWRAENRRFNRHAAFPIHDLGEAHIHQHRFAKFIDHDVVGLDVPVNHAVLVPDLAQGTRQFYDDADRFAFIIRTFCLNAGSYGFPFDVVHRQVLDARNLSGLVCPDNVRMLETGCHFDFLTKSGDVVFAGRKGDRQNFQCNFAIHGILMGKIYFAHAATAQKGLDGKIVKGNARADECRRNGACSIAVWTSKVTAWRVLFEI